MMPRILSDGPITSDCPVKACECGSKTFRFHEGTHLTNEGFECTECEEFYSSDNLIRTAEVGVSDAAPGL